MPTKDAEEFLDGEHLLQRDYDSHGDELSRGFQSPRKNPRMMLLSYSIALNIVLAVALAASWAIPLQQPRQGHYIPNEVYSPAKDAVKYKTVVFTGGLHGDKSEYQGSSAQVDEKWEALYNLMGMSQISSEQAAHLPNKTTPVSSGSSEYMVELDVFHQLHCLNLMRKLVYPHVYELDLTSGSEVAEDNVYHMEHCYEQLRQSLQCASDTGTIYWEWSTERRKMFGNLRTTHTCRDFDKIHEWATEHKLQQEFDWWQEVEGAPIRTDPVSPESPSSRPESHPGGAHASHPQS